jgi:hypothetical protein
MEQSHKGSTLLNPDRFVSRIQTHADFLSRLPRTSPDEYSEKARGRFFHRAIAARAFRSPVTKQPPQKQSLDANLFKLAAGLKDFYEDSRTLDYLRNRYGRPQNMPPRDKDRFYDSKLTIISFNDTLVEVIDAGASQFDSEELLTFMTDVFSATNGGQHASDFRERAREAIVGMRNEMAVEQILAAGGVDFRRGTAKEDSKGGDYFIEGVPFDFKSNEDSARRARMRAEEGGYDSGTILWSHVTPEDFEGKLTLPYDKRVTIFAELKPELDAAIASHKQPYVARIN